MYRKNTDDGKSYVVYEATGQHILCDSRGVAIKPFNPKITGRFNFDDRQKAVLKANADLSPVELPLTLKPNFKRNYVPQHRKIDGYA